MDQEPSSTPEKRRPKIGLVVGSGGIKCTAAIPLFEFLDEAGIDIDLMVLCSGGATLGAVWALGASGAEIRKAALELWTRELFAKIDYRTLLSIAGLPFGRFDNNSGMLKPDVMKNNYVKLYGDAKIEDLKKRTIILAADLLTGDPVALEAGLLRDAVYASSALYPILPPQEINGQLLIDGAFCAPLPILEAVVEGMDIIIAMSFEERSNQDVRGFLNTFMRVLSYSQNWLQKSQSAVALNLHHNEIISVNVQFDKYIGLRSVHKVPEVIAKGEETVAEYKDKILAAIENFRG